MLSAMLKDLDFWARRSAVIRALYQGAPIVYAHRVLSALGLPVLLGRELYDMARLRKLPVVRPSRSFPKKRVLFVIPRNFRTHATFQVTLAQALTLRGAECAVVTCGGVMPVCEVTWAEREWFPRCARCMSYVTELAELAGIRCFSLADQPSAVDLDPRIDSGLASLTFEELKHYAWEQIPLGEFAVPPTRWRLRTHDIAKHPDGRAVLSGFIRGGVQWETAIDDVLNTFDPYVLVMLNGLFMEERVAWAIAKKQGRRCVFFEKGRDAGTVFLTHDRSAPRYDVAESWEQTRLSPLTEAERRSILAVMDRRSRGEQMVETYWDARESDQDHIRRALKLEQEVPMAVLFTNVVWDTSMQDRDTVFDGMLDWLRHTIHLFRTHPEWNMVARIHPAETQVPGRESFDRVGEWITQEFTRLPSNIRVVPPDLPVDSYALMRLARTGLVYASTAGLELAVTGTPVVVAGDAHYRGKGFTYDSSSREEYDKQVEALMRGERAIPEQQQVDLALRYAHLFFLRRMLPMSVLTETKEARPRLAYDSLEHLMPGRLKILDMVCDGILNGTQFELVRTTD